MKRPFTAVTLCCVAAIVGIPLLAEEPDLLIADFEGEDYGDWKVEGKAFGKGPDEWRLFEEMEVTGQLGRGYVNSFHGGDESTGTLTSPSFEIERDYINFLIGGGGFEGETCMNLIVNDKVVRSATGPNTEDEGSEALDSKSWKVVELKGEKAQIQIVDKREGGWGHILVDHIVQSDLEVRIINNVTREFTFEKKYLNLPVQNEAPQRLIHVPVIDR